MGINLETLIDPKDLSNTYIDALLGNERFVKGITSQLGKADTINQALNLLWYDLRPVVQLMYPFKELIPRISRLPRVPADGGNAFHWKRITAVNVGNISVGVSEGNRGGVIAINTQDQTATYKTMGLESSTTFEARLGAMNLVPDALGNAVQSTLRSVLIGEEQTLMLGNANMPLGTTPTPTAAASGTDGNLTATTWYIKCVALAPLGNLAATVAGGVPGKITRTNADSSTDTYGGGSAAPSAEQSVSVSANQHILTTVAFVPGAVAYAWYWGTTSGAEVLGAITRGNQLKILNPPAGTQIITALSGDNSTNNLLPDGVIEQIYGQIFGPAPSTAMATSSTLPSGVTLSSNSGSLYYQAANGNTGLTVNGSNITEIDLLLEAAYEQYKIGYSRILMSASDIANLLGQMLGQNAAAQFRILFDADAETGRIVAGRRITSYLNKFMGNTLDIEIHPYLPPGFIMFWSDNVPYELSGVPNILEAHVRMDYYQIQWPFRSRRYEYGCYVDEVFPCYFPPAFGAIVNVQPTTGTATA